MGSVHRVQGTPAGSTNISIALSLNNGLNGGGPGGAQAIAGPNGAFASAGGGLGSMAGFGQGPNGNALAGNFGGPQNPYQAGFQQGQKAAKMKKLMRKMHKLMQQMGMGGGAGHGIPGYGGPQMPGFPGGGAVAFAGRPMLV